MAANRLQRDDDRRLNLEQQKTRAKELLRSAKRADPPALERFRQHHPDAQEPFQLSDAQLVIARELGLPSWPKLKAHIEDLDKARRAVDTRGRVPDADLPTVHIRCGSDIRERLKEAGFVGDFLEFGDPLWLGPVSDGRDGFAQRGRFIADAAGLIPGDVAATLQREYAALVEAADRYGRIVIWCEHDPYDQLCLARVLAELAGRKQRPEIELIAIEGFPVIQRFNGLGQLSAAALRLLWERRTPVAAKLLRLGAAVWDALRDPSPAALGALAASGTPELPMMAGALTRHLQELPWRSDGLSLTQRLALQALHDGPLTVSQVFWHVDTQTEPLAFTGDLFFWAILRDMLKATEPPFAIDDETATLRWPQHRLSLTVSGRALLAEAQNWMSLNPPERWVGGVRVAADAPAWRWDGRQSRPVRL